MNPFETIRGWIFREAPQEIQKHDFIDLAPTSNADETGIYFEALDYATNNDDVFNIALTGPYGSGKSSVIKSFLLKYRRPALQLSLASFLPDGEASGIHVTKQEIERSILQQILYGADADRLPLSRFKRIQTPKRSSVVTSLFAAVGIFCAWYVFSKQSDVLSGTFFKPLEFSNWFNVLCFVVAAAFVWKVIHSIYLKSFGLSLKSISLKDVEIAPDAANQESILNRHLDEIIYFFQSTEYDLVVIEDLDRFDSPDIFVTLREINGVINANAGIRRRVRFLYALRDDIFVSTDRTKFFEFIVPIIPVINRSNSIDKVLEQGQRIKLDARLDRRFVREVSRYLDDLRLIRNIFNEYLIYSANLGAEREGVLDPTKLLAVLIYKNVIPKEFAALHRQEGALSKVLSRYDEYVARIEHQIRTELSAIETDLADGEAQSLRDRSELRQVYAMAIVKRVPANYSTLHIGNVQVALGQLADSAELETAISQKSITASSAYQGRSAAVDLRDVEASVDPTRTFAERAVEIDRKSTKFKERAEKRSRELKGQLASLRTRKFNEVVRENAELIEEVFAEVGDNKDLLKFLILEGYLDDTYYQYISLFHSGRLSPNDNKFLIQIRSYKNPEPDSQIDNCAEVIVSMRPEDFGTSYVLNRFLIDHLLDDQTAKYSTTINAACDFMAAHFDECQDFLFSYYQRGTHVDRLVHTLAGKWLAFPAAALDGTQGSAHAARIIAYAPKPLLERPPYANGPLADYFSLNAHAVLSERIEFDFGRLKTLRVQVDNLPSISGYPDAVSYVSAEALYRISIDNIRHVMEHLIGWSNLGDLETRNFSTVLEANDQALLGRLNSEFETYVRDVLLQLPSNANEDVTTVVAVLHHDEVDHDLLEEFLRKQAVVFPTFEGVPSAFHPLLLRERKVEGTWENCLEFLSSEGYDPELLTQYLQDSETNAALSRRPVPDGDSASALRDFLIGNDDLEVGVYRSYVRKLPNRLSAFPDVEEAKVKVLIEERKVSFSGNNFDHLEDEDLQVLFISLHFDAYQNDADAYPVDDGFRKKLLSSGITDAQKLAVIADIDPAFVSSDPSLASAIGPILDRSTIEASNYDSQFAKAVIVNSRSESVQVSLFNKLHRVLSDDEARNVLGSLPEPFREIAAFGKWPKIDNNEGNRQLASWLKERKLISSFSTTFPGDGIRIYTFKKET